MSETMKAMVYLGPGKKEVLERPKPTPQNSKAAVVKMLKTFSALRYVYSKSVR